MMDAVWKDFLVAFQGQGRLHSETIDLEMSQIEPQSSTALHDRLLT